MKHVVVALAMALCISLGSLMAQSDTSTQTIEDLYLSTEIEILLLRSQALSDSRDSKLEAVSTIRRLYEEGRLAENEEAILTILGSLATEGLSRRVIESGAVVNDFPEVRRRSLFLLGEIGGARAESIIQSVIEEDRTSMVLAEGILALGRIGRVGAVDAARASRNISYILRLNTSRQVPDSNVALACIETIDALRITDNELLIEMVNIVNGGYLDSVRERALEVIYKIRDGRS